MGLTGDARNLGELQGNWENKAARDGAVNRGLMFVEAFSKILSELELVVHMYTLK